VSGAARGYSWPPFEEGNTAAVKHGAYAVLQLKPRAEEIAGRLREAMGETYEPRFEASVEAAALAAPRVEAAMGALLEEADQEKLSRLDQNARGWLRLYLTTLERFGLMPEADALRLEVGHRHQVEIEGLKPVTPAGMLELFRATGQMHHLPRYPRAIVEPMLPLLTPAELELFMAEVVDVDATDITPAELPAGDEEASDAA
jgi:hypothetical protein